MASLPTSNVFDPNNDIPDLSGKVYVVTGGSAGIGFGIVAHLLQHNAAQIYLLSAKAEHANSAILALQNYGDYSRVEWMQCNLKDLRQTLFVAQQLKARLPRLDALICNAAEGVSAAYSVSDDGIDSHFQVNHLAQMLLSLVLLPVLQQQNPGGARLVLQSSDAHRLAPADIHFADLHEINTDIGPADLYNRTKLAQLLFARRLHKLLSSFGAMTGHGGTVYVNATHPGGGVATEQTKQAEEEEEEEEEEAYGALGKVGGALVKPRVEDPVEQGCRPVLWAATSPDIVDGNVSGQYIVPDKKVAEPSSQARDEELAKRLWVLSEEILVEKLGRLPYDPVGG